MSGLVFFVASLSVCVGFGLSLILDRLTKRHTPNPTDGEAPEPASAEPVAELESELVRELLKSLQELTSEVNENVDRHAARVAEISTEFDLESVADSSTILKAAKKLVEANKDLQKDLATARSEIRLQRRQIQSYMTQARTDELTGLPNRRVFEQELRKRLAQWQRQHIPLTLMLVDVDHFKRFNDYHGHQAGDKVLQEVARLLQQTTREMDVVTRYGGEEFAVVLPGTTLDEGKQSGERIREAVAAYVVSFDGSTLSVTISVGVAQARKDESTKAFVERVDKCLYAAKKAGRNCTYCHEQDDLRPVHSPVREATPPPLTAEAPSR